MPRALVFFLALGLAPAVAAQPMAPDAAPVSGTLSPGADAASVSFEVRASTEVPVDECYGYVDPSAPDAVIDWEGGDLRVWVRAPFDATLAVHRPDGTWACDDDTEGVSPVVAIAGAPAGRYAIWLGAFAPDPFETEATLYAGAPPPPPVLAPGAPPLFGTIEAAGGFEASQGTIEVSVRAGGPDSAGNLDESLFCSGYIDAGQPTAAVDYTADGGTGTLAIGASSSDTDLVLVVQGPGGTVTCNDDYNGTDPLVVVEAPASGTYTVWAGTYASSTEPAEAVLAVAESAPDIGEFPDEDYGEYEAAPYSEGTYFAIDLGTTPSARLTATDEAGDTAGVTLRPAGPNPVQGLACAGYVEAAPTAAIELAGDGPFALTATSDDDLTLTVRTPGGTWFCSDDADGLNPGIQIDAPEAGVYLAWAGTFGDYGDGSEVTLSAAPGEIVVTGGFGPAPLGGTPQSDGTYGGSEIAAGPADVTVDFDGAVEQTVTVEAGGTVLNPVEGEVCHGFLSAAPSATIEAAGAITIAASSPDQDLTLVVQAPDGSWTCSDDADGTDPRATVAGGEGTYSVWVGTYYRQTLPASATLRVAP